MNKKEELNKDNLYDLYIKKNRTMVEIGKMFKCSRNYVSKKLREFNIEKDYEKIKETMKINREKTCLNKYGVINVSQIAEVKQKKINKSFKKYGTKYVLCSKEIRNKIEKTNMKIYGVTNPQKNNKIQEKTRKTNLEKYGKEYPSQVEEIKNKIKKTNLKKYGVENVSQNEGIKNKIIETNKKIRTPEKIKEIDKKICKTNMEKYGVPYFCMTKKCRDSCGNIISKINKNVSSKLLNNNIENKLEFNLGKFSYDIKILNDNILLEINPSYTHNITYGSEFRGYKKKPLDKNYHQQKTKYALENGYECVHIWDWDDIDKIISILKPKQKIYARNCKIKEINKEELIKFETDYHLQGYCNNQNIKLGLFYLDELVQIMTFGKPRYNKKYEYELIRLCSHSNYKIVGGASKLFKYFIKKNKPRNIISYCDNSKFSGKVYNELGFVLEKFGKPGKHWYNEKTKKHITDNLLRQHGYDQLFKTNYGKGTNNRKLMIENGFVEIYDSGQSTYIYEA